MEPIHNQADVVYFGRTDFRNQKRLFGIKRKDRRQHTYIIGKSGTGKSTLINNFVAQDIANGEGLCVVDPHGELVEAALRNIPKSRIKDVVYFNPSDIDFNIGFNILELAEPQYKHLVASGLMGIFTKIWANVWSARMEYILNNTVLALLDTKGSTLLGIPKMLVDKEYRAHIISNIQDPVVRAFWVNEYEAWEPKFRNEAIAPIQNKVGQFLASAVVRNIVGQPKNTIDVFEIMNSGKILLVNLSKGRIGEDNSALLGAMIITKIQLAAMDRVRIPEDDRRDFYLYVDEFQNFATDSFASILSEARKYRLNLIVAHQYIGQLVTDTSTKVRDAIFGNVGTMIIFRVGAADAEFLEKEMSPEFVIQDIVGLPNYHIYLKMMVQGVTSRPFSAATLEPFKLKDVVASEDEIIAVSRSQYTRPRALVEEEIETFTKMAPPAQKSKEGSKNFQQNNSSRLSVDRFRQAGERVLQKVSLAPSHQHVSQPTPSAPIETPADRSARQTPFVPPAGVADVQKSTPPYRVVRSPEKKRSANAFSNPEKVLKPLSLKDLSTRVTSSPFDSDRSYSATPPASSHAVNLDILKDSINDALKGLSSDNRHGSKQKNPSDQKTS